MAFNQPTPEVIEKLKGIAPGRVFTGADIKEDYGHDEMPVVEKQYLPAAVVEVLTTEEVSAVCKLCYENDIPIVPRGAGTGLSGGCVATEGGVIVDTTKMNKILGYDLPNFVVRVQPGVLVNDLAEDAAAHGVAYPPEPGEKFATVGGNVATNAGGMKAVKYGCTRDYVRAMTVVLPDGTVMKFGAEVAKTSTGYNLAQLMIGSEGTLAIITELSMKVVPPMSKTASFLALFPDLESCIECASKIRLAGLAPQSIEYMDRYTVTSIEKYMDKVIYPSEVDGEPIGAYLLVAFDTATEEEMDSIMESAAETFVDNGAMDVMVYDTPESIRTVWSVRANAMESISANHPVSDECDIVLPIPEMPAYIKYANDLGKEMNLGVRNCGHAGDGNVHVNTYPLDPDCDLAKFMADSDEFLKKLYDYATERGGQMSGEHGIGYAKAPYLVQTLGPDVIALMRRIKFAFDPKGLLNPGKVLPLE